jgi:hypothetical protein
MAERFYHWLMRQAQRQDAVGQLARELAAGGGIPDAENWLAYSLGKATTEDDLIRSWKLAWAEWDVAVSTTTWPRRS